MQRKCVKCGEVNTQAVGGSAEACPACGVIYSKALPPGVSARPVRAQRSPPTWLAMLLVGATLVVAFAVGTAMHQSEARKPPPPRPLTVAELQINDAIQRYEITARGGDSLQMCVSAMGVAAAHLLHKKEAGYHEWLAVEKKHCNR